MNCLNATEEFTFYCGDLHFNVFPEGKSYGETVSILSSGRSGDYEVLLSGVKPEMSDYAIAESSVKVKRIGLDGLADTKISGVDSL